MKLEDVEIGQKVKLKDVEKVTPEHRGRVGTVTQKGDFHNEKVMLLRIMLPEDRPINVAVEFEDLDEEFYGGANLLEPVEEFEVGDKAKWESPFHTIECEVVHFMDQQDWENNDTLIKYYDQQDDLNYALVNTDELTRLILKEPEDLEKGDEFIDDFGDKCEVLETYTNKDGRKYLFYTDEKDSVLKDPADRRTVKEIL